MRIDEIGSYVELERQIPKDTYKQIVTIGRGGLSVAQKLAYYLEVPIRLLQSVEEFRSIPQKELKYYLFVDDIEDTSATLMEVPILIDTAVLVQKSSSHRLATYFGVRVATTRYVQFSWEGDKDE